MELSFNKKKLHEKITLLVIAISFTIAVPLMSFNSTGSENKATLNKWQNYIKKPILVFTATKPLKGSNCSIKLNIYESNRDPSIHSYAIWLICGSTITGPAIGSFEIEPKSGGGGYDFVRETFTIDLDQNYILNNISGYKQTLDMIDEYSDNL